MSITRQMFLRSLGASAFLWQTRAFSKLITEDCQVLSPVIGSKQVFEGTSETAKVYFSKHRDADHLMKLYNLVNSGIEGQSLRMN
ncbi:MAG: hypothetical protein LUC43_01330 [Burkholderiales bacterium]|nr:hypothetical protein [Burkholderiales bacterium]